MNPLLKAGLAATALGAALGAAGSPAHAADLPRTDPDAAVRTLTDVLPHVVGPVKHAKLNPLAGTGVNPLDNGVGTQIADFRPVDTASTTGSLAGVQDVPVVGPLLGGLLPG
ncbi:hypothetical protein [Streptomyces fradiae]|uniref:hypothetical protein n=1 Tax=Streptomyces fradiae TaxID=1906 RepID=UPI0035BE2D53